MLEPLIADLVQRLLQADYYLLAVWQLCEYDTQESTAQIVKDCSGSVYDCVRSLMKNSVSLITLYVQATKI